ncbi:hypothetical protein [Clostridium sp. DL1XJH146]
MGKNKSITMFIFLVIFLFGNYHISYAKKNNDLINNILSEVDCKVIEYGIEVTIVTIENFEEEKLMNLLKSELVNSASESISKADEVYIKVYGDNGNGEIQKKYDGNQYYYVMRIFKNKDYELLKLKEKVLLYLNENFQSKINYSLYVQCKLNEGKNLEKVNNQVISEINSIGASDVNTIELSNGFSTTANTHMYSGKLNNGIIKDFNFAVCNYSSGNYLIIGTPEINRSY